MIINYVLIGLVVFLILLVIYAKFYTKSSKDIAFVRTGMFGQRIVLTGGALALPIFHQTTPVNMNSIKLEIERKENNGFITKDKMRVDIKVDFYVRVFGNTDSVALAAQTLGARTLNPKSVQDLMEGKFVDAMRSTSAGMTLEELQTKGKEFTDRVYKLTENVVTKNGLELESVSLSRLDQTSKKFFDPGNTFDAEGLIKITEETEASRKKRNEIEKDTELKIEQTNLNVEEKSLEIKRQSEYARIQTEMEISTRRAEQSAEIAKAQAESKRVSSEHEITENEQVEKTKLKSDQAVQKDRINTEKSLREADLEKSRVIQITEIEKQKAVKIAEENQQIELFKKQKERAESALSTRESEAKAVTAEEQITTARELARAEREKSIALLKSRRLAEEKSLATTIAAEAEKIAATDSSRAKEIIANAEATAERVKRLAEADGLKKLNEAANTLTSEQVEMKVKLDIVKRLPDIIKESVKPIENIEGIKIVDVNGLGINNNDGSVLTKNGNGGGTGSGSKDSGDVVDRVVEGALRYRTQAPILDKLVKEVGLINDGESLSDIVTGKSKLITGKAKDHDKSSGKKR